MQMGIRFTLLTLTLILNIYSYISIVLYNLYIVHKRMHKVFIDVTLLHICSTILYVFDIRWGTSPLCFISMIAGCQETR